jgi:DNA-binding NtrC family response regulator
VILITAYATIESAVEAIRAGAYEYFLKPIVHEDLKALIKKAFAGPGYHKG